jgi:hypothetical protein
MAKTEIHAVDFAANNLSELRKISSTHIQGKPTRQLVNNVAMASDGKPLLFFDTDPKKIEMYLVCNLFP